MLIKSPDVRGIKLKARKHKRFPRVVKRIVNVHWLRSSSGDGVAGTKQNVFRIGGGFGLKSTI